MIDPNALLRDEAHPAARARCHRVRERGALLSLYLLINWMVAFILLEQLFRIVTADLAAPFSFNLAALDFRQSLLLAMGIVSVGITVSGVYMAWNWRIAGIYLLIGGAACNAVLQIAASSALPGGAIASLVGQGSQFVVQMVVLWFVMRGKWAFFD